MLRQRFATESLPTKVVCGSAAYGTGGVRGVDRTEMCNEKIKS
jgi:hypothetical protein